MSVLNSFPSISKLFVYQVGSPEQPSKLQAKVGKSSSPSLCRKGQKTKMLGQNQKWKQNPKCRQSSACSLFCCISLYYMSYMLSWVRFQALAKTDKWGKKTRRSNPPKHPRRAMLHRMACSTNEIQMASKWPSNTGSYHLSTCGTCGCLFYSIQAYSTHVGF